MLYSDSPTCVPRSGEHQLKLTLMSESLRNDGRIWVPKNLEDVNNSRRQSQTNRYKRRRQGLLFERRYPAFGNLTPRDVALRAQKKGVMQNMGVNQTGEWFI